MSSRANGEALKLVRTLFDVGTLNGLSDGQLLDWFRTRDRETAELAFTALVERHGPMVLRVCRRMAADAEGAQDAFQATFLLLVRRAASVRSRDSVASWLHGVAIRVAVAARKSEGRRRWREARAAWRPGLAVGPTDPDELTPALHEELAKLPSRFREPMVLCYLEGRTCEAAAEKLDCPVGTIKSRLARGRERLRKRLIERGVAPSANVLFSALSAEHASTSLPASLACLTARAALTIANDSGGTALPAAVLLMQTVWKSMILTRLKHIACLAGIGLSAAGTAALSRSPAGDASAPQKPAVAPPSELSMVSLPDYVVEPPDLITVEVLDALPKRPIIGDRLVQPDGKINLGYYGEVYVAGLTTREIKTKVVRHLRQYLNEAQLGLATPDPERPGVMKPVSEDHSTTVKVDVSSYNSKFYYVQGAVGAPGRFPITGHETVLDAVNFAGGLLPSASSTDLNLVRLPAPGETAAKVLNSDLNAIVNRGESTTNYQLRNGDRLIVITGPQRATAQPPADRAIERRLERLEAKLDRLLDRLGPAPTPPPSPTDKPPGR